MKQPNFNLPNSLIILKKYRKKRGNEQPGVNENNSSIPLLNGDNGPINLPRGDNVLPNLQGGGNNENKLPGQGTNSIINNITQNNGGNT